MTSLLFVRRRPGGAWLGGDAGGDRGRRSPGSAVRGAPTRETARTGPSRWTDGTG